MTVVTRFAPSPTGLLHLGHAHAALFAEKCAREPGGVMPLGMRSHDGRQNEKSGAEDAAGSMNIGAPEGSARGAPGGRFLLRIEDIDRTRCRNEFEAALIEDLAWLGLSWETPVRRQSAHMGDYARALARLETSGLVYPCFCTRRAIAAEIAAAAAAP
ncbi:MAG: glutamate--tRNA ligase family protein, partial [Pseudomonadota bacterium]